MNRKKLLTINIFLSLALLALLLVCLKCEIDIKEAEATKALSPVYKSGDASHNSASSRSYVKSLRKLGSSFTGNEGETTTIMLYLNGCSLETDGGAATMDLKEILKAGYSDQVNVVVETISTCQWQRYHIASDRTQRYAVTEDGLSLVCDNLGQQDVTDPAALTEFIRWTKYNYPADRYVIVLWNHGGGPVEGFGYNEWGRASDALTIAEMQTAFEDAGVYFDIIGFDACIMSSLEICYGLYDYCDYMILSEDFESSLGWYYTDFLTNLYENPTMDTVSLGTMIVDDMVSKNESSKMGAESTLALIDMRFVPELFKEWQEFAYANEEDLRTLNYSKEIKRTNRAMDSSDSDKSVAEMDEYYITDIMAVASSIDSSESKSLIAALNKTICYYNSTYSDRGLTGMYVIIPYKSKSFYKKLKNSFLSIGIDRRYITWLNRFVDLENSVDFYDYEEFDNSWEGWDS